MPSDLEIIDLSSRLTYTKWQPPPSLSNSDEDYYAVCSQFTKDTLRVHYSPLLLRLREGFEVL